MLPARRPGPDRHSHDRPDPAAVLYSHGLIPVAPRVFVISDSEYALQASIEAEPEKAEDEDGTTA